MRLVCRWSGGQREIDSGDCAIGRNAVGSEQSTLATISVPLLSFQSVPNCFESRKKRRGTLIATNRLPCSGASKAKDTIFTLRAGNQPVFKTHTPCRAVDMRSIAPQRSAGASLRYHSRHHAPPNHLCPRDTGTQSGSLRNQRSTATFTRASQDFLPDFSAAIPPRQVTRREPQISACPRNPPSASFQPDTAQLDSRDTF